MSRAPIADWPGRPPSGCQASSSHHRSQPRCCRRVPVLRIRVSKGTCLPVACRAAHTRVPPAVASQLLVPSQNFARLHKLPIDSVGFDFEMVKAVRPPCCPQQLAALCTSAVQACNRSSTHIDTRVYPLAGGPRASPGRRRRACTFTACTSRAVAGTAPPACSASRRQRRVPAQPGLRFQATPPF